MARQLRITEEQARMLRAEGITLNADVAATNGNVDQAVRNTRQQAKDSGVDPVSYTHLTLPTTSRV